MKRKLKEKRTLFAALIVLWLFVIFFVGRSFNPDTGKRNFILTTKGISHFRKGLDVSGGTKLVFKVAYDKYEQVYEWAELTNVKSTIEKIILQNIDNRISALWVSDYKAYVQNMDNKSYIVVEIGGVADLDQAKEIIWKTVELEFRLPKEWEITDADKGQRKILAQELLNDIKATDDEIAKLADSRWSQNIFYNKLENVVLEQLPEIFTANPKLLQLEKWEISALLTDKFDTVQQQDLSGNVQSFDLEWYTFYRINDVKTTTIADAVDAEDGSTEELEEEITLYDIELVFVQDRETWKTAQTSNGDILNGAYFKFANTSQSQIWLPVVVINFDDKGKEVFCNITTENIGKQMAIFIGGEILTSPTIQAKICGWTAQIDWDFTMDGAKELVDSLNNWALPAPLILMQEEKLAPTLGDTALIWALIATLVGIIAIFVYMYLNYGFKKSYITLFVLLSFIVVLGFVIKMIDYALSLSWIAAVILSIWMVVDANILIYERQKEEEEEWKNSYSSIDVAYNRSRPAIKDGNLTTGIIALLLFMLWSNMFKWFGFMLMVTVALTLLFNVPLTKMLLKFFYKKWA